MTRLFIPVVHGAALDRPDERDTIEAAAAVAGSLRRLGYESEIVALGLDLSVLARLAERWPHVVFNLVEALDGNGGLADLPLAVMDHLGLAYTGATRAAYALSCSKLATKQRILRHGVPTPGYWPRGDGVPSAARVIVKSVEEHASIGMDADSVVSGKTAAAEVRRREARFGGQFFAEDYIEGREFNVSLIEMDDDVRVLPIQETLFTDFPAGRVAIVDYEAKWNPDSEVYNKTPRRFGVEATEPDLAAMLGRRAVACWKALGLTGYARVDFRVSGAGDALALDVNANPCLGADAGFIAATEQAGLAFDKVIRTVVDATTRVARKAA